MNFFKKSKSIEFVKSFEESNYNKVNDKNLSSKEACRKVYDVLQGCNDFISLCDIRLQLNKKIFESDFILLSNKNLISIVCIDIDGDVLINENGEVIVNDNKLCNTLESNEKILSYLKKSLTINLDLVNITVFVNNNDMLILSNEYVKLNQLSNVLKNLKSNNKLKDEEVIEIANKILENHVEEVTIEDGNSFNKAFSKIKSKTSNLVETISEDESIQIIKKFTKDTTNKVKNFTEENILTSSNKYKLKTLQLAVKTSTSNVISVAGGVTSKATTKIKDSELVEIIKQKPKDLHALIKTNILDDNKIKLYGEDIIKSIQEMTSKEEKLKKELRNFADANNILLTDDQILILIEQRPESIISLDELDIDSSVLPILLKY